MKIKHRIIGDYATKLCFFDLKKLTLNYNSFRTTRGKRFLLHYCHPLCYYRTPPSTENKKTQI